MMEPAVNVSIVDRRLIFFPEDRLVFEYEISVSHREDVQAVEASVLWYTEGKGDEDMAVHSFQRRVPDDAAEGDLRRRHRFETALPRSPLSYHGTIVRIRWCVRVRVFLKGGREIHQELPIQLGDVPRTRS